MPTNPLHSSVRQQQQQINKNIRVCMYICMCLRTYRHCDECVCACRVKKINRNFISICASASQSQPQIFDDQRWPKEPDFLGAGAVVMVVVVLVVRHLHSRRLSSGGKNWTWSREPCAQAKQKAIRVDTLGFSVISSFSLWRYLAVVWC